MSSNLVLSGARQVSAALTILIVTQAAVVMAFFTVPVLGVDIANGAGLPVSKVGYFTSIGFAAALVSAFVSGAMVDKFGPVRTSQITVAMAAIGLALIMIPHVASLIAAALVLGFAYGPGNPASSALLSRLTPPERRGIVFSLKQTAVPLGGLLSGSAIPFLAGAVGLEAALGLAAGACLLTLVVVQRWRGAMDVPTEKRPAARTPFGELLVSPVLRRLAVFSASMASIQFTFGAVFVIFLQVTADVPVVVAGPILSVAMGLSIVVRILLGFLADRVGGLRLLLALAVLGAVVALVLAVAAPTSFGPLAVLGVILGTVAFSWNGVFLAQVASAARPGSVATATAGAMFFVFLGGLIGPALASTLTIWSESYTSVFVLMAVLGCIAALAVATHPEK